MNKLKALKKEGGHFCPKANHLIILSRAHRFGKKKKRKIGGVHGSSQSLCKIGSFYYRA